MSQARRFVGRAAELAALQQFYESGRSAFVPIYGRRRVGKTELIHEFSRDKPTLYFLGKRAPAPVQIREFLEQAAIALDEPLLAAIAPTNWRDALTATLDRWAGDGKLILVFDEFQWTAEASPELPSYLQEFWDQRWQHENRVLLILCGSYLGFMEREVLGRKSPLFGRRTGQIRLRPFDYRESALMCPAYSRVDQARAYFICGGIPLYLDAFDDRRSIEQNLQATLLNEHSALFAEPHFLLREELREVENYHAVLLALAEGVTTFRDLARVTGLDKRLSYYLDGLQNLGYVRKRYPLTDRSPPRTAVRYELHDPLLRFWFRFVYPHLSFLARQGPSATFQQLIKPDLEAFFGHCFERLCREALPFLYGAEGVTASAEIGEYWDKHVQVDVVGLRDDGWTDLGECKWGSVRSPKGLEAELESKVPRYPNGRNATISRRLFTRRRLTPPSGTRARWHSLDDLYEAT